MSTVDQSHGSAPSAAPVLEITEAALARVLEIRNEEEDGDSLGLRIAVSGVRGVDYTYDLAFEPLDEALESDTRFEVGDGALTVLVPDESVEKLQGATLDLPSNPMQGGLVIRNPNRPDPLAGLGDLELTGDIADKVRQLLDGRINPSLAAHGGYAQLVGVEGSTVYLTMGGGCQGCAMSQLTLTEGIKASILQTIPEVTEVVDATDHSAGDNPYY